MIDIKKICSRRHFYSRVCPCWKIQSLRVQCYVPLTINTIHSNWNFFFKKIYWFNYKNVIFSSKCIFCCATIFNGIFLHDFKYNRLINCSIISKISYNYHYIEQFLDIWLNLHLMCDRNFSGTFEFVILYYIYILYFEFVIFVRLEPQVVEILDWCLTIRTQQLIPESEICIATATIDSSYVKFVSWRKH